MPNEKAIENVTARPVAHSNHEGDGRYVPNVDIRETQDEFLLLADVPGADASALDIRFERGQLTLHAVVPPRQSDATRYLLREYGVGDFERTFQIGEGIDAAGIHASIAQGVLTLHLPKAAGAQLRRIEVHPGN